MKNISIFTFFAMSLVATFGSTKVIDVMNSNNNKEIKYDAFINLAKNIKELNNNTKENDSGSIKNEAKKEDLVISSIEKELNENIRIQKKQIAQNLNNKKTNLLALKAVNKSKFSDKKTIVNKSDENILNIDINKIKNNNEDLSKYEINNSEIVNVFAFNASKISFAHFESLEKLNTTNNKNITLEDNVSVNLSSTIGPIGPKIETKKDPQNNIEEVVQIDSNDDLKVFDYSKKENDLNLVQAQKKVSTQKIDRDLYERPISETVKKAISREIGSKKSIGENNLLNKNSFQPKKQEKIYNSIDENDLEEKSISGKTDEISLGSSALVHSVNSSALEINDKDALIENIKTLGVKIRNVDVYLDTHKIKEGSNFEFIPDFDRNERIYDSGMGEIEIGYPSKNNNEISTGTINKTGSLPTRVELLLNNSQLNVPTFEENSYRKFLEANGVSKTNSIIIKLSSGLEDIDIDSDFEKKIFLDSNFNQSENGKKYIMFAGLKSGNILLKYKTNNGPTSQKIIYIGEEEIYFEYPEFDEIHRESFELTTRNLMSTKNKELNLKPEEVKIFNTNIKSKKNALNVYELKFPQNPFGNRKYLELNYQGNLIFVGTKDKNKIEIPQKEFIEKVLEFNQLSNLDQRCLVQINLTKEISNLKTSGKNATGEMYVETSSLDNEGKLSSDNFENAEKIFLVGEQEGIMNAHIEYVDGAIENLKTFCSNNTFLIEQL